MVYTDLWTERYETLIWWVIGLGNELTLLISGYNIKLPSKFFFLFLTLTEARQCRKATTISEVNLNFCFKFLVPIWENTKGGGIEEV